MSSNILIGSEGFNTLLLKLSAMAADLPENGALTLAREDFDTMIAEAGIVNPGEALQGARSRVLTAIHRVGPRPGQQEEDENGMSVDKFDDIPHTVPFRVVVVSAARGVYALHRIVSYANHLPKQTQKEQDQTYARYLREIEALKSNALVDADTKAKLIGHAAAMRMLDRQQKVAHDALMLAMNTGVDAVVALARDFASKAAAAEVDADMARSRRLIGK